ncbi:MAG: hypothetical protein JW772_02820 [Candidatus Diapherotrites archaeon]|nr:hypothetical protein [Candidatus Diapherotrites archaeon]
MLILEKQGILFALIQKRFENFAGMARKVQQLTRITKGAPVVIVFPEDTVGRTVLRPQTKDWIRQIQPALREHGQAHVFFSVYEKAPLRSTITNTGYLVGPSAKNPKSAKPMHWQAYAKIEMPRGDSRRIKATRNAKQGIERWNQRAEKMKNSAAEYNFPSVTINGKRVELRVCADIILKSRQKPNVLVVPAWGLEPQAEGRPRDVARILKTNGFAIVNDLGEGGTRNPSLFEKVKGASLARVSEPKSTGIRGTLRQMRKNQRRRR